MIHYENHWAVVTGASSGLGRGFAARLADRGMSLVLTGRSEGRLKEAANQIRRAALQIQVETVAADLSTPSGVSALLDHVRDRPIEVLINNAGFGSYGPFAETDPAREAEEVAVDVSAVVALAHALLPGMIARGSGGILNVASTIAFQPAPYQAVYGASKAFVLSFSQALWAEACGAGVAVTALCPGPTRTGFVDALGVDVGHTAIYRQLGDPEPVIEAGLRALDKGRAVVIAGLSNKLLAESSRLAPRELLTLMTARLLGPANSASKPPIVVRNEILIHAAPERVWDLLTDVERWPLWYRACRWVRVSVAPIQTFPHQRWGKGPTPAPSASLGKQLPLWYQACKWVRRSVAPIPAFPHRRWGKECMTGGGALRGGPAFPQQSSGNECREQALPEATHGAGRGTAFQWKAHPVTLQSTVTAADPPRTFAFVADTPGIHAERTFMLRPAPAGVGTVVVSYETQVGFLARLGRLYLGRRLYAANQAMFADLARAAEHSGVMEAIPAAG